MKNTSSTAPADTPHLVRFTMRDGDNEYSRYHLTYKASETDALKELLHWSEPEEELEDLIKEYQDEGNVLIEGGMRAIEDFFLMPLTEQEAEVLRKYL